jgi:hypothetical protein
MDWKLASPINATVSYTSRLHKPALSKERWRACGVAVADQETATLRNYPAVFLMIATAEKLLLEFCGNNQN